MCVGGWSWGKDGEEPWGWFPRGCMVTDLPWFSKEEEEEEKQMEQGKIENERMAGRSLPLL